jgi:elongation factor Ts
MTASMDAVIALPSSTATLSQFPFLRGLSRAPDTRFTMEITASMVKELRERSGAGMMECKKALVGNNGDIDAAIEWLRKQGLAKADKKASRIAAEGRIVMAQDGGKAVMVEVNSETDFVAKDENFLKFADEVAKTALTSGAKDVEELKTTKTSYGPTIEEARQWLVAKVGENVQIRRLMRVDGNNTVGAYVHGGRIGVLVETKGGGEEFARAVAMHVAAMNPPYNKASDVPPAFIEKEKEIELAKMSEKDKSKPAPILEKIIGGKLAKIVNENTLYGQPYVLNTDQSVEAAAKAAGANVLGFQRLAVGEGIEKPQGDDFATEVMKQAGLK